MLTAAAAPAGWKHCTSPRRRNLYCAVIQTERKEKKWGKRKDKGKEKRKDQEDERKVEDQQEGRKWEEQPKTGPKTKHYVPAHCQCCLAT